MERELEGRNGPTKAVVVYESMYGNTHQAANAIGEGLRSRAEVTVVPVGEAHRELVESADLLVVGGPTHFHGMSRGMTRAAAVEAAEKPGRELELEPDVEETGLRDWFDALDRLPAHAAAFDTRVSAPAAFTGRASKGIAKRLRHHGASLLCAPESFLVTKGTHLEADEEQHARAWGAELARSLASTESSPAES